MFGRHRKLERLFRRVSRRGASSVNERDELYRIDFEMMTKGSIYKRRSGPVRQVGVTVRGATRLVTSGDVVDRETYEALVAAGAIRPIARPESPPSPPPSHDMAPPPDDAE